MTRPLLIAGWVFVAVDLIAAALTAGSRGGDAATRGLGPAIGGVLAVLACVAALLLWIGRVPDRGLFAVAGGLLAAAPLTIGLFLTVSRMGPALIYPSLRERHQERLASPQYAFPDAPSRDAALAIVMNDYARLDTLLQTAPRPDLTARDERGVSLLGLGITAAIMDGGSARDLEGLRLLLAAGATPQADDLGPDVSVLERVASDRSEREATALGWLLDAGLSPNLPMQNGDPVLFHPDLAPEAARLLLSHGADPAARPANGDRRDWSAVTYQADLRRWATALALLNGGVPRDHGTPAGSVLARVLRNGEARTTDQERADPAFQAFMSAVAR
ncbi:MAG: hypothetical protein R2882_08910 [Gemmatimonadales bacterium]